MGIVRSKQADNDTLTRHPTTEGGLCTDARYLLISARAILRSTRTGASTV